MPSDRDAAASRLRASEQIPPISAEVFEDGDAAVRLVAQRFDELHTPLDERGVIAIEVVGLQEERDAAAGLVTDSGRLQFCRGLREQ